MQRKGGERPRTRGPELRWRTGRTWPDATWLGGPGAGFPPTVVAALSPRPPVAPRPQRCARHGGLAGGWSRRSSGDRPCGRTAPACRRTPPRPGWPRAQRRYPRPDPHAADLPARARRRTSRPATRPVSRIHAGPTVNVQPLPSGETVPRNRLPSIVPPTGCPALAPHASSGSNGTAIIPWPRGPAATTALNR